MESGTKHGQYRILEPIAQGGSEKWRRSGESRSGTYIFRPVYWRGNREEMFTFGRPGTMHPSESCALTARKLELRRPEAAR